ncbi:MAG: hypothetical protein SGI90_00660 [Candidatus Eisenbacteria bacterium]|nr:hypothetical protein [Candidatus Eisenbacteria bacterium]
MKRVLATMLLAGIATVGISTGANAAGNANAKIMLHALTTTTKNVCLRTIAPNVNLPATCSDYNLGINNKALYPTSYFTYLLVVNGSLIEGIAGVQCGVDFNGAPGAGVDVFTWSLCATLEFSSTGWPQDGGGNLITWNATGPQCLTPPGNATIGAIGVAGYFYMAAYTPDLMRVIPRPVDGVAKVANCGSVEDIVYVDPNDALTFLGAVGFGQPGINPCGRERPVGIENATWSGVKTLIGS